MLDNVKEIHIEPTSLCNAECPMCARNVNGKGLNPYITLKSLPAKWFHENIKPEQIAQLDKIFFCGNVGDPASAPELVEISQYFKKHNPNIVIGLNSNGGLKTKESLYCRRVLRAKHPLTSASARIATKNAHCQRVLRTMRLLTSALARIAIALSLVA